MFAWNDPLLLHDQLTEDEKLVQESAQRFAREELLPGIVEANRHEKFDVEIMRAMGRQGLLGSTISGYGCAGTSQVAYGLIARAVEWVDSGQDQAPPVCSRGSR